MTWLVHAAHSEFGRMVAATMAAFLRSIGHMHHVVVISGEMFIALLTGDAPFGLGDWARVAALATVTNAAGGLVLVTVFRFAQVGPRVIEDERHRRSLRR
jgi:formate-nitrite transporter family protein